ncbi:MAG: hypothetical protein KAI14_06100 [Dehalococcoidales bacterium]|nr:hypothetical protein [Dehalococcoidales bacterium]
MTDPVATYWMKSDAWEAAATWQRKGYYTRVAYVGRDWGVWITEKDGKE